MSDLLPGQLEMNGLRLGPGTPYVVTEFAPGGKPEATVRDRPQPRMDGRAMGRDVLTGRTIDIGLGVDTASVIEGSRAYAELARSWNAAIVRGEADEYVPLRMRPLAGLPTRMVWGRPRKFEAVNEYLLRDGRVDIVADFDTIDPLFYTDLEAVVPVQVPLVPPQTGGWTAPFTAPIVVATTAEGFGDLLVEGYEPTPLVARIYGPITNPQIDVLGSWRATLSVTLAYDQWADIDARPWVRRVLRSDGVNLASAFTVSSPPLSALTLLPGQQRVTLRGLDATGTAYMVLSWQGAGSTPYWI